MSTGDELRPVTALFADIVGSTRLGERLPPGELKQLIGECVSRMSRSAEEFGGTIQAYTGDGICAYFGVPAAHEDDPERAARAGLRILAIAREYAHEVETAWGISDFNVRVGINTGQSGVGLVGGSDPQQVALGDTTNVAARLQAAAVPGTIAVGPETARRLPPHFRLEALGEITVKGRTDAVAAWRLTGLDAASPIEPATPMVGREVEMGKGSAVLRELEAGRGQILLVFGEAGIGKTRLLAELRALAGDSVEWLQGACPSYSGEALPGPFVQILARWLGTDEGAPEVAVRTRLRARLGELFGSERVDLLQPLGAMLGVRIDPGPGDTLAPPEERAEARDLAYRAWIERLAEDRPLVVAVDDLHWAHPFTRSLAEHLLELTERSAVLVAVAFRPDPTSEAWPFRLRVLADYAHRATEVPLGPLPDHAAHHLAALLLPPDVVDETTRAGVIARSEGNPLYLEELLRGVAEGSTVDRSRTWSLSLRHLLPPTLESLFVARIDRLPERARHLVQTAAVIGREFARRVLERVSDQEGVDKDLAVLLRTDLIREVRRYPELVFAFRHGLVQEAALSTLTADRLRDLYGRVGRAVEELYPDGLEARLDLLAFYFYRGDDPAKAVEYLERGVARAIERGATDDAAELLRRIMKVAGRSGDPSADQRARERLSKLERG